MAIKIFFSCHTFCSIRCEVIFFYPYAVISATGWKGFEAVLLFVGFSSWIIYILRKERSVGRLKNVKMLVAVALAERMKMWEMEL